MPIKGPRKELTLYLKSGNIVTLPLEDDAKVDWSMTDVITSLRVDGLSNPYIGVGFSAREIEVFTVKQV